MRNQWIGLGISALFAFVAAGQTSTQVRTFSLSNNETPQDIQEMVTLIRAVGEISQVSGGNSQIAVTGSPEQLAVAGWLIKELDQPAIAAPAASTAPHEYRVPGTGGDLVRVFYLSHVENPQQLQEIVTTIRSTAGIRGIFTYNARRAFASRATPDRMGLAAWLVDALDRPAQANPTADPHEYLLATDDLTRVFYLNYPETPQQLQEIATALRSVADIQRLFLNHLQKAVVLRASRQRVDLATWLIKELDQPVNQPAASRSQDPQQYQLSFDSANLVQVFFPSQVGTPQQLQELATRIRINASIQRLFVYNGLNAVAARGTPTQIALAQQVVEEFEKAPR